MAKDEMAPVKNKTRQTLRRITFRIADFIFPRTCLVCGKINPKGVYRHLCGDCAKEISLCTGCRCLICGEILGGADMPDINGCPKCMDMQITYSQALCPTVFSGPIKRLVHAIKYSSAPYAAEDLATAAAFHPKTKDFLRNAVVVPVPLYRLRRLKRGYNQAEVIARALAAKFPELNIEIAHLLRRTRNTSTQTRLTREERTQNIRGAFETTPEAANIRKDAPIVIFDDVMTTAATANECAKTLRKAGFKNLRVFAIAKKI